MRPQRGKLVALTSMAAAACVVALVLKHVVEVELDLYKLQHGTLAARKRAAERLAEQGCARAIPHLLRAQAEQELQVEERKDGTEYRYYAQPNYEWAAPALRKLSRPEALPTILKVLKEGSPPERCWAVETLAVLGPVDPRVLAALAGALDDPDAGVRTKSAETLGAFGPEAEPLLLGALADPSPSVRKSAALSLGWISSASVEVASALKKRLEDADRQVRQAALVVLAESGVDVVPELAARLGGPDYERRRWAIQRLGEMGLDAAAAVPSLRAAVPDTSGYLLVNLVTTLGRAGAVADEVVPALLAVAATAELQDLRNALVEAMRQVGSAAVPHLLASVKDADGDFKSLLAEMLLATVGSQSEEAVPALVALIDGEDDARRYLGISALSKIGSKAKAAVPALRKALALEAPEDRAKAARALGDIGPGAAAAKEDLERLLRDEEPAVRIWAAYALGRIKPGSNAAVAALEKELVGEDLPARIDAAEALGRLTPDALRILNAPSPVPADDAVGLVRWAALSALLEQGEAGQETFLKELEKRFRSAGAGPASQEAQAALDKPEGSPSAMLSLLRERSGSLSPALLPRLRDLLLAALRGGPEDVREISSSVLLTIGLGALSPEELLARWPRDGDWSSEQLDVLSRCPGGEEFLLQMARSHPDPTTRTAAIFALADVPSSGRSAVPFLIQLLDHPQAGVRIEAVWALGRLGPDAEEALGPLLEAWHKDVASGPDALEARRHILRPKRVSKPYTRLWRDEL